MGLTIEDLISLGQYVINVVEDRNNEIDIKPEVINALKKEVLFTKRFIGDIPQDDPELNKMVAFFKRQKPIVDEVIQKPHLTLDIEFTVKFIASNQCRINDILKK